MWSRGTVLNLGCQVPSVEANIGCHILDLHVMTTTWGSSNTWCIPGHKRSLPLEWDTYSKCRRFSCMHAGGWHVHLWQKWLRRIEAEHWRTGKDRQAPGSFLLLQLCVQWRAGSRPQVLRGPPRSRCRRSDGPETAFLLSGWGTSLTALNQMLLLFFLSTRIYFKRALGTAITKLLEETEPILIIHWFYSM